MGNSQHSNEVVLGVKSLIQDGLRLNSGDRLLILYQTDLSSIAELIVDQAQQLGLNHSLRSFPRESFHAGQYPPAFEPSHLLTEHPVPAGIALLIEWSEPTTNGRLRLLANLQDARQPWRVASMPGVEYEHLAMCVCDFSDIRERSRDVFAVLARGQEAKITTRSPSGSEDILRIPVSGCPILSTGEIANGTWGNFPSGEVFTLPSPYRSSGWLTLRGSFPNFVLSPKDWVRFEVKSGRIRGSSLDASTDRVKCRFRDLFFTSTGRAKSKNSNTMAELGIGTNRAISDLTGRPIFDEKKLGTLHLGIGTNKQFKGPIDSAAHHDITIEEASLSVGNVEILREGQYCLEPAAAIRRLDNSPALAPPDTQFWLRDGVSYDFLQDGDSRLDLRLAVKYFTQRGDAVEYTIARGHLAVLAHTVVHSLKRAESPATLGQIFDAASGSQTEILQVLNGLIDIRIVGSK